MNYCKKCILPDTRPNLKILEDGVCSACHNAEIKKEQIDWEERRRAFEKLADKVKTYRRGYDCLIPVSGGKDSTWQVVKCLEYGLKPLAVTWKTPARTELGQKNLDNLVALGVDHIDYQISPKVESKFILESFKRYGSTAIPMHMALFSIPLNIAFRFDIPLVVWGENSAQEYGSGNQNSGSYKLDSNWLSKYGVTHGTTAHDWVSDIISEKDLTPYYGPTDQELEDKNIEAVFLGYFFNWSPEESLQIARQFGFKEDASGPRTGYYNFADIDDDFISIHHWLKWYKFGFTRTWDNLALEIRNGHMSREEALAIVAKRGDETPLTDIDIFCRFVGITNNDFFNIAEGFRNKAIWKKTSAGWQIKNFLIKGWQWK